MLLWNRRTAQLLGWNYSFKGLYTSATLNRSSSGLSARFRVRNMGMYTLLRDESYENRAWRLEMVFWLGHRRSFLEYDN